MLSIELATSIKNALIEELPEINEEFEKNFQQLNDDLVELDNKFKEMASAPHPKRSLYLMPLSVISPIHMALNKLPSQD